MVRSIIGLIAMASLACTPKPPDPREEGNAALRLRPLSAPLPEPTVRRTVYVPVYSSIYAGLGRPHPTIELTATISIHNVSPSHRLVLNSVRYYDSDGKHVRDYISTAGELPPMGSVQFVVALMDTAGGPGANFLIEWAGAVDMDEPLVESIMTGQVGTAGISFTSPGRALKEPLDKGSDTESPAAAPAGR